MSAMRYPFPSLALRLNRCVASVAILMTMNAAFSAEAPIELRTADGATKRPLVETGTVGAKCAVLFFYLHDCPICNVYAPEIERIITSYKDKGFSFYIVQTDAALTADVALKHAKEYGLTCPVLMDGRHLLAKRCGATITPQAAIVNAEGNVLYVGRIDDLYADYGKRRSEATVHDLREALDAVVAGKKPMPAKGSAVGCFIALEKNDEKRKP